MPPPPQRPSASAIQRVTAVRPEVPTSHDLEPLLQRVESGLAALGLALQHRDAAGIDAASTELQTALLAAVGAFSRAARSGAVPRGLHHRLALARAQIGAQREALARATAGLDRALAVLLPPANPNNLYSAAGAADRPSLGGDVVA